MGITIIQKSDLSVRKPNAKVALVLAGGAVTGGASLSTPRSLASSDSK